MSHDLIGQLREVESLLRRGLPDEALVPLGLLRAHLSESVREGAARDAALSRHRQLLDRTVQVVSARGLEPVAEQILDAILETLGARRGVVGVREGERWRSLAARAITREDLEDPESSVSHGIIRAVLETGQPLVTGDASLDFSDHRSVSLLGLRSVLCLPLADAQRPIGFVYLDNPEKSDQFDAAAVDVVRAWLPLATACVARASTPEEQAALPGVLTRSGAMQQVITELARAARFDAPVLMSGETGTGKSLIARQIHAASPRAAGPFLSVNCGAIPESLVESELFGHLRGSFTGAAASRPGRFEAAQGGTLFLDELDSLPLAGQVKLLLALQERQITRVGANTPTPIDVRVIAAIGSDPQEAMSSRRLREDLYYRLAVFSVRLPPLRERPEDIPALAELFLEQSRARFQLPPLRLTPAALDALLAHSWPGNVRELANVLDRAALMARDGWIERVSFTSTKVAAAPSSAPQGLLALLRATATALVDAAQERPTLRGLDVADALRGYVLRELVARLGDRDAVFRWLGQEEIALARNHHRVFRREESRVEALERAMR